MEKSRPEGVTRKLTGEGAGQHTRGAYAPQGAAVRFSAGARQGEADGHRCQLAGLGGELDGPAVGVDYPLGNAQAQPAAFHLAVVAGVAAKKALALMSVLTMDSFCVD